MSTSEVQQLLERYVERLEQDGTRLPAEALCGRRRELVAPLEEAIGRFETVDRLLGGADASAPPGHAEKPLPTVAGFRTVERIGTGGMGVVYKLEDLRLGRAVAAKFLRRSSELATRYGDFLREARALALFQDPRIVKILEYRPDAEPPMIIMEHVAGFELGRIGPSLDFAQRARVMAEVCDAIHHAHQLGVQHRDLKPSNILLDEHLTPRILDFGLAASEPLSGHFVGTLAYLAPEQLDPARRIDERSDVYALGVVLYELLCGERPFGGSGDEQVAAAIQAARPRLPVEVEPSVPEALQAVALKAMEAEPGRRYPSAREMARDLERFLAGRPVLARPTHYASALGQRVQPHLEQIREWVSLNLVYPHEAERLADAYRRLEMRDEDWIVASRRLSFSQIALYLGAFLLLAGALFYFVARRFFDAPGGLLQATALLGLPFVALNLAALTLERRERKGVAIALYLGAASVLAPYLLVLMSELGLWVRTEGQFFDRGAVSNRQLQVAAVAACAWAGLLALRTRTVALCSACAALAAVATLAIHTDLGLRSWLEEGRWDVLSFHLLPLLLLYALLGRMGERTQRPFLATPFYLAGAALFVLVLELAALHGRALAHLGISLARMQPAEVTNPVLLDTLAAMTANGVLVYLVGTLLEHSTSQLLKLPSRLLLSISPFAILEPIAWLNHTEDYSRSFLWAYLALALGITAASRFRQRKSFYYAGLLNTGLGLVLVADRYEWLDSPGWAMTVVTGALVAVAAGVALDLAERRRPERSR